MITCNLYSLSMTGWLLGYHENRDTWQSTNWSSALSTRLSCFSGVLVLFFSPKPSFLMRVGP